MSRPAEGPDFDVDLQGGVIPISKAASALAALIKRARERRQPIIVTQKGYPSGVLLPVDLFITLRNMAERKGGVGESSRLPALAENESALQELDQEQLEALADEAEFAAEEESLEEQAPPAEPPRRRGARKPRTE